MDNLIKVLLIDDSRSDADLLRAHLEEIKGLNYELDWVTAFDEGLERALENQHDLYLVDYTLGAKTGVELIRAALNAGCQKPMVLYSGREDVNLGVTAISQGAADYLVKDHVNSFTLEKTVRNIMERERILQENVRTQMRLFESQRLESLGLMAGGIAHDFNNILGIILANVEMAKCVADESEIMNMHLTGIHAATERASELIGKMLAYSGKSSTTLKSLDLIALTKDTVEFARVSIPRRIQLEFVMSKLRPMVVGDPLQMRQVILNLLHNAADAVNESGRVLITTEVKYYGENSEEALTFLPILAGGYYVRIAVEDNGVGIAQDLWYKIFDPFYTTKAKGRGLGLAAVMGIVKAHRGGVKVKSVVNQGTTIELVLPFEREPVPEVQPTVAKESKANGPEQKSAVPGNSDQGKQKWRVLVVDDESEFLLVLTLTLESHGYEVVPAPSFDEAWSLWQEHRSTLNAALIDMTLVDKSGFDLYEKIRQQNLKLPVIFMSGYNESEEILPLVGRGEVQFLRKPFARQNLFEAMSRALKGITQPK